MNKYIKVLLALHFVFMGFVKSYSQPKNYLTIPNECENYIFNFDKVKIKLKESDVRFSLSDLEVTVNDSSFTPWYGCKEYIPIEFDENPEESIAMLLRESYPQLDARTLDLKLRISQWKVLHNLLPTENPRMYLTLDFFVKNIEGEYYSAYSSTEFILIGSGQSLEKPFGKLLSRSINNFYKDKKYRHSLVKSEVEIASSEGIFTSFESMKNRIPEYKMTFDLESDTSDPFKSKYNLVGQEGDKYFNSIYAFMKEGEVFLNVAFYYPKSYFTRLFDLSEDYYFIYDQIYDYTKANSTTAVSGGGLLGAAIGAAAGQSKSPALIEKKSGQMKSFNRKQLKELLVLSSEYTNDQYLKYEAEKDLDAIMNVFKSLIKEGHLMSIHP